MIFFLYIDEDDVREMQVYRIVCFWSCCVMKPFHYAQNIEKINSKASALPLLFNV